ncbi:hypothetical protein P0W64_21130 [Tsukamurella sp. 8F]|uniref:hypothetical protein n=1 Tax=unclassified Tsukamurella TaxID=2633480 RepID=UPI0023B90F21|nr:MULTISPECIES: hypothetical protein [unclassified Tsukamurella]MDF0532261.1 hypothetical protein [Tsukamurella sp. 8J]MDF0589287.1 hypothetical protein [Tsukamurella sp. 8F]
MRTHFWTPALDIDDDLTVYRIATADAALAAETGSSNPTAHDLGNHAARAVADTLAGPLEWFTIATNPRADGHRWPALHLEHDAWNGADIPTVTEHILAEMLRTIGMHHCRTETGITIDPGDQNLRLTHVPGWPYVYRLDIGWTFVTADPPAP